MATRTSFYDKKISNNKRSMFTWKNLKKGSETIALRGFSQKKNIEENLLSGRSPQIFDKHYSVTMLECTIESNKYTFFSFGTTFTFKKKFDIYTNERQTVDLLSKTNFSGNNKPQGVFNVLHTSNNFSSLGLKSISKKEQVTETILNNLNIMYNDGFFSIYTQNSSLPKIFLNYLDAIGYCSGNFRIGNLLLCPHVSSIKFNFGLGNSEISQYKRGMDYLGFEPSLEEIWIRREEFNPEKFFLRESDDVSIVTHMPFSGIFRQSEIIRSPFSKYFYLRQLALSTQLPIKASDENNESNNNNGDFLESNFLFSLVIIFFFIN